MSTTSALKIKINRINIKDFIAIALWKFYKSINDMIVTVAITGASLVYMAFKIPAYVLDLVSGYYIAAMVILVLIRVVRRFDNSYTTGELAEQILRIEKEWDTRWGNFIDNYIP